MGGILKRLMEHADSQPHTSRDYSFGEDQCDNATVQVKKTKRLYPRWCGVRHKHPHPHGIGGRNWGNAIAKGISDKPASETDIAGVIRDTNPEPFQLVELIVTELDVEACPIA